MDSLSHLSPNLSVAEFLRTQHVDLVPEQVALWQSSPELRANSVRLAEEVFEPCRKVLRVPLRVTSGLRCPPLNERVGGQPTSRHLFGLAVDVVPTEGLDCTPAIYCLMHALRRGELPHLDKAIVEGSDTAQWLHLQAALDERPARGLFLTSANGRVFGRVS